MTIRWHFITSNACMVAIQFTHLGGVRLQLLVSVEVPLELASIRAYGGPTRRGSPKIASILAFLKRSWIHCGIYFC